MDPDPGTRCIMNPDPGMNCLAPPQLCGVALSLAEMQHPAPALINCIVQLAMPWQQGSSSGSSGGSGSGSSSSSSGGSSGIDKGGPVGSIGGTARLALQRQGSSRGGSSGGGLAGSSTGMGGPGDKDDDEGAGAGLRWSVDHLADLAWALLLMGHTSQVGWSGMGDR